MIEGVKAINITRHELAVEASRCPHDLPSLADFCHCPLVIFTELTPQTDAVAPLPDALAVLAEFATDDNFFTDTI